jgi:hypothetical protein
MILGERGIYGKFTGIDAAQVASKERLVAFLEMEEKNVRVRRQPILAMLHRYKRALCLLVTCLVPYKSLALTRSW